MASRYDRQSNRGRSEDPRYAARRAAAQEELDYRGFEQTRDLSDGREEDAFTRGGGYSMVSPSGGEYLRGEPTRYGSEAYPEQGFGKVPHARTSWRMEDKIFGSDSMIHDRTPGQQYSGVGPRGYQRSDQRIQEDACEALSEDDRLDASNIEVTVSAGEITLKGTVRSREDKRRAEYILESVRGVKDIHNQLRIESPTP